MPNEIHAEMHINNIPVKFQVDCRASVNILPAKYLPEKTTVLQTNKQLSMWNGTRLKPKGTARIIMKNPTNRKCYSAEFVIVEENLTPLLGSKAIQAMNLITVNEENFQRIATVTHPQDPFEMFPDVHVGELGTLPGHAHLEVDENVTPVISPPRRISVALKDRVNKEIDRLTQIGVIAPVDQPTRWVSQMVASSKKSGAMRICIDPRPLNKALKREHYPLPTMDDILPALADDKVFSKVDLRNGYWHVVLDEESSFLTTFQTPQGRFRWRRLPFGISVSSEIFQKRLNQALDGLRGVCCIADDVTV